MLKRPGGSKKLRAQIRHENANLGRGAGVTTGPIDVPGHNTLPSGDIRTLASTQGAGAPPAAGMAPARSPAPPAPIPEETSDAYAAYSDPFAPGSDPTAAAHVAPRASTPSVTAEAPTGLASRALVGAPSGMPGGGVPEGISGDAPTVAPRAGAPSEPAGVPANVPLGVATPPNKPISPLQPMAAAGAPGRSPGASLTASPSGPPSRPSSAVAAEPSLAPAMHAADTSPLRPHRGEPRGELAAGMGHGEPGLAPRGTVPELGRRPSVAGVRDRLQPRVAPPMPADGPPPGSPASPATPGTPASQVPAGLAAPAQPLGSLTRDHEPAALELVLAALNSAARRHQTARITGAESEKPEAGGAVMQPRASRPVAAYVSQSDEPKFRAMNAALRKVKHEWGFIAGDSFSTAALALALAPGGRLRDAHLDSFRELKTAIEGSLQGTLDDHYESFATAITLNHGVIGAFGESQNNISAMRLKLRSARDALGSQRADLVQMWQRLQSVKEALRVLALLEKLRSVPDELESLMAAKRFLHATQLLMRSLKLIQRADLVELGATADLRSYLRGQELALLEILVEELHNHLYLKSSYTDARWKSYVPGQDALPDVQFGSDYTASGRAPSAEGTRESGTPDGGAGNALRTSPTKLRQFLGLLSDRLAYDAHAAETNAELALDADLSFAPVHDDGRVAGPGLDAPPETEGNEGGAAVENAVSGSNPEADSFLYIEMLLESLGRLGKLGYALEVVAQRLPMELHQLVDSTIDEVDLRHEAHRHLAGAAASAAVPSDSLLFASSTALTQSFLESGHPRKSFSLQAQLSAARSAGNVPSAEYSALQRDMETMKDFFWTLFSKLDAVLQGHRVVQEVAGVIFGRGETGEQPQAELGVPALVKVWQPIQQEVRSLLHDYLSEETQAVSVAAKAVPALNDLLRAGKYDRDHSHPIFRMLDTLNAPRKGGTGVRNAEEAVDAALRSFVPGLVSTQESAAAGGSGGALLAPGGALGRSDEQYTGAGHRLLVRPLTFTVSVLFRPTLAFVQRVEQILPADAAGETAQGFGAFLEEFVEDMFLPLLEDKVQAMLQRNIGAADAFVAEPLGRTRTARPVVKSAVHMVALVDSLYSMLVAAPFHRESYSRLILLTLVEYYQLCNERFKRLVSVDDDPQRPPTGPYMLASVWAQRRELYATLREMASLKPDDARLAEAYHTEAQWELRYQHQAPAPLRRTDLITSRKRQLALGHLLHSAQWFVTHLERLRVSEVGSNGAPGAGQAGGGNGAAPADEALELPFSQELARRFQQVPSLYRHLAQVTLFTLREEVHIKTLFYLNVAIGDGAYVVDAFSLEPDPHVVDLNAELAACNDTYKDSVLPEHHRFLFDGLDTLMDSFLVRAVGRVRAINRHGVTKMMRNILSLQQNLKNIVAAPLGVNLEQSKRLWSLVSREPEQWFGTLRASRPEYPFEVYLAVLQLCLGVDREAPVNTDATEMPRVPRAGTTARTSVSRQAYDALVRELHALVEEPEVQVAQAS